MMTALVVTFLSGASSGFVAGRASAPDPVKPTWVDQRVEDLRRAGVDDAKDLELGREIYLHFQQQVMALKGEVTKLFQDRIRALQEDAERQIREKILSRYSGVNGENQEN
jgi:hypothetical protein